MLRQEDIAAHQLVLLEEGWWRDVQLFKRHELKLEWVCVGIPNVVVRLDCILPQEYFLFLAGKEHQCFETICHKRLLRQEVARLKLLIVELNHKDQLWVHFIKFSLIHATLLGGWDARFNLYKDVFTEGLSHIIARKN